MDTRPSIPALSGVDRSYGTWCPTSALLMPIKTIDVPTMGDSITEGTIVDIPVAPGDYVKADDVVLVLETDKVSIDVRAPEGGSIVEILGEVDDVVEVGSGMYRLDTDGDQPEGEAESPPPAPAAPTETAPAAPAAASATPTPPPAKAPSPKKASPAPPLLAVDSVTTSLGNRPERRSKMSRMR